MSTSFLEEVGYFVFISLTKVFIGEEKLVDFTKNQNFPFLTAPLLFLLASLDLSREFIEIRLPYLGTIIPPKFKMTNECVFLFISQNKFAFIQNQTAPSIKHSKTRHLFWVSTKWKLNLGISSSKRTLIIIWFPGGWIRIKYSFILWYHTADIKIRHHLLLEK